MTSPLQVLVVEDDRQMLGYLCALLASWGFKCVPATSASDALAVTNRIRPDVVISDLVMPGMDGVELLKALRTADEKHKAAVFFVLLTGFGTVTDAVRAVMEGADEVLVKPLKEPVLLGLLQRIEAERRPAV